MVQYFKYFYHITM